MRRSTLIAVLVLAASRPAGAQSLLEEEPEEPPPTPWDQGRISLGISLGSQGAFGERYFAVGGGVGYFVLPGLALSLSGERWFGGDPGIARLTPEVRYVAYRIPFVLKPYAGVFYNHWFIGQPFDDVDTVGGRLGLMINQGGGLIIGGGVAVERTLTACDDCVEIYPDIVLALSL